jgi:hypothetical protein
MLLGSSCSGEPHGLGLTLYGLNSRFSNDVRETTCDDGDLEANRPEQSSLIDRDSSSACQVVTHKPPKDRSKLYEYHKSSRKGGCKIEPGQSLPCGLGLEHDCGIWLRLSDKDVQQWTRATEALRQEPDKYKPGQSLRLRGDHLQKKSANFQDRPFNVKEVQEAFLSTMSDDPLFWLMLIALPMVYGSVHLTAWNFDFPSRVEQIMWRVACIIIAGGILGLCIALGIIAAFVVVEDRIFEKGGIEELAGKVEDWLAVGYHIFGKGWIEKLIHKVGDLLKVLLGLYILGLAALYFGARLFVIVESFISMRRLPLGVFVTVHWANYIPHL